ncbi:MAG: protein-tyrosine phosphatase-like protein [Linnemannia gamsii]|nr:MAG: protein-tyrosine phosphatase-like protein [Linnemannia gamsii]
MSSAGPNNTSPPRSRLHLGSLPSMITKPVVGDTVAQTPMIENPNVNPLFESVRQAMGLNTDITEEIPVRLPSGFSVDMIREHLPRWLLNAVDEPVAKSRLARYFQKVEIIEKKRLALLMCPQVMRSGKECDYSIGSGIEKGLKNRYNNVWPFDQTRIKIKELEQGGDDYINASLLTPPFGQRTYIATQAPLPTTFLDFWKVVWEQNSRVVVMLTREVEMGRVKCHKYWPTAQEPVLDLGPVRVTFVSEYQPHGHGTNGPSSLSSSVLVRQMRLRHLLSPQEPERTITQLQYTGWPDFGVPDTPLEVLQLIELADKHNNIMPAGSSSSSSAGPMVVHCSAGCGRTGAFCVIDSVLSELKYRPESILCERSGHGKARQQLATGLDFRSSLPNERVLEAMSKGGGGGGVGGSDMSQGVVIDEQQLMADVVFATVTKFREQRLSMVQCLRQYVFCYEAILWHLGKEFSKGRGGAEFSVFATPKIQVPQTPAIAFPPHSRKPAASSGFGLSMGNAPITTTNEEFSYFG